MTAGVQGFFQNDSPNLMVYRIMFVITPDLITLTNNQECNRVHLTNSRHTLPKLNKGL